MSSTEISALTAGRTASVPEPAPAPHWHNGDSGGHVVQFYSDDAFLLEALSKSIGTALVAGNAAVVIATQSHLDDLADRLASRALSVGKAAREGRYIALNAADTLAKFMRDGQPDADLFAAVIGPVFTRAGAAAVGQESRVVAFGEMVALLWAEGNIDAAIRLEQLWNDLARRHAFSLHCAYPITGFHDKTHAAPFLKICSEHSAVIPGESYTALASEQDRLRNIAELQQKAQALETEKALLHALRQTKEALEREVAERREAQRKLHNSELSLRELSAHLLRTQDAERRRLGRELHDRGGGVRRPGCEGDAQKVRAGTALNCAACAGLRGARQLPFPGLPWSDAAHGEEPSRFQAPEPFAAARQYYADDPVRWRERCSFRQESRPNVRSRFSKTGRHAFCHESQLWDRRNGERRRGDEPNHSRVARVLWRRRCCPPPRAERPSRRRRRHETPGQRRRRQR